MALLIGSYIDSTNGAADCLGGQAKEWMGCLLDDLRAFSIDASQ